MTYPKLIAFLIPGPSCCGNITLLLSKPLMWLFLIMIWLFWKVPSQSSGACQLCPRYKKLPAQAGQQGTNNPRAVPAAGGTRGRARVLCFTQITHKEDIPQLSQPCPQVRMGLRNSPQLMGNALTESSHYFSLSPFETAAFPSAWMEFFSPCLSFPWALGWNKQASITLKKKTTSGAVRLLCEIILHVWQWSRSSRLSVFSVKIFKHWGNGSGRKWNTPVKQKKHF